MWRPTIRVDVAMLTEPTDERDLGPLVSAWVCRVRGVGLKRRARWAVASRGGQMGVELSVRIHTPILLPFAPISYVFCTCFPPRSAATIHRHGR
jgi:hypothetical protein